MICMKDHQSHEHRQHDHAVHGSLGGHGHGGGHGGHDHHNHGDMVEDFKKRFYISLIVTIPILILSPIIQGFIGVDWRYSNDEYILFALATFMFLYCHCPYIYGVLNYLKDKNTCMLSVL